MSIQLRRGDFKELDARKLLPGEYAVVLRNDPFCKDGRSVYICFNAGDTKRMATYEDMKELIADATQDIVDNLTEEIDKVIVVANGAILDAETATKFAHAVGEDLIARREAGEFQGEQGECGVVTTTKGQIAFQITDGNLFVYYHDGDVAPECSINEEGNLMMNFGGDV